MTQQKASATNPTVIAAKMARHRLGVRVAVSEQLSAFQGLAELILRRPCCQGDVRPQQVEKTEAIMCSLRIT